MARTFWVLGAPERNRIFSPEYSLVRKARTGDDLKKDTSHKYVLWAQFKRTIAPDVAALAELSLMPAAQSGTPSNRAYSMSQHTFVPKITCEAAAGCAHALGRAILISVQLELRIAPHS